MDPGYPQDTPNERRLATVETVGDLRPIPDADSIEVATVRGWNVVVKIGEFRTGDSCIYFEIDSMLPLSDARFAFLESRGVKMYDEQPYHRLKTARLRGTYSQGLLMPLSSFPEIDRCDDIAKQLGVIKYEPPLPPDGNGEIAGAFPSDLGMKTDAERIQNLTNAWDVIQESGPWIATEKIDGTSMSVFVDGNGDLRVCGRNWEIRDGNNMYWNAVRQYEIATWLHPGEGVQCELYGEGINKNPLKVKGRHIAVFHHLADREITPLHLWPEQVASHQVPIYPIELPVSLDDAIYQAEQAESLVSPSRIAEGIVWQQAEGHLLPVLGYRCIFKVVSNRYLLKYES
ncbi:MAG: RNA ligase (ATP) [Acidimicrobiales bacterium]